MFESRYKVPGQKINISRLYKDIFKLRAHNMDQSKIDWYKKFINSRADVPPEIKLKLIYYLENLQSENK